MKPITQEWVDKAEADYTAALLFRGSRKKFIRDITCFHLQQCVEKYLKGRMAEEGMAFPKTHDLEKLLDLVVKVEPLWETLRQALSAISNHAVEGHYPGHSVTPADARNLLAATTRIRKLVRSTLGLP